MQNSINISHEDKSSGKDIGLVVTDSNEVVPGRYENNLDIKLRVDTGKSKPSELTERISIHVG